MIAGLEQRLVSAEAGMVALTAGAAVDAEAAARAVLQVRGRCISLALPLPFSSRQPCPFACAAAAVSPQQPCLSLPFLLNNRAFIPSPFAAGPR